MRHLFINMQLKWFLFVGFVLNVLCLNNLSGKFLSPKNDYLKPVLLSLQMDKLLVESLQMDDASSIAQLFVKSEPEKINQVIYMFENLANSSSISMTILDAIANDAINNLNTAESKFETAKLQKVSAEKNYNELESNFETAKLQKVYAVKHRNNELVVFHKVIPETISILQSALDSSYTLVFRQTVPKLFLEGEYRVNADDSGNANYAILDELESYRNNDGRFYFRLMWPGDSNVYEWSQTSNPVSEGISGYKPIKIPYTGQHWGGLEPSENALMDGSVNHDNWFYAVGSYSVYGGGIPAYAKTDSDHKYSQQKVELYVWKKPG